MTDILTLDGVAKAFRGFTLEDVSFTLPPGYILGLIGPNGAGKTTTIKLIMNMLRRDRGTISNDGIDNVTGEPAAKTRIVYVSDETFFVEEWRTTEVERALRLYYDSFDHDKFQKYLHQFDLPTDRAIKHFSRGMKTRLMLAAALSRETRLLLLDEPASGLDPAVRSELLDLLQSYISDGTRSVLFSTHITTDLERVADYIAFLYNGNLVFADNRDEVLAAYCVVKGRPVQLTPEWRRRFIGLRENALGFEGLIRTEDTASQIEVVTEPATLDDIVVYHTKGASL